MTSRNRRLAQAQDVKRRAKAPAPYAPERCAVFGCYRLTQRSAGRGLSETLCKRHAEHLRSHGHETRRSYSKAELEPFRQAAREWFRQHQHDAFVRGAIARLESLLSSQGRAEGLDRQRSMDPKDKARNTLARLHGAGKTGEQLFHIVLTIKAAHAELGPWGAPDWEAVQIAKQAKRLRGASGTRTGLPKQPMRWPRGEGIYMRHLGRMIEERAAYATDPEAVEEVRQRAMPSVRQAKQSAWEEAKAQMEEAKAQRNEEERTAALLRLMGRAGSITIGTS